MPRPLGQSRSKSRTPCDPTLAIGYVRKSTTLQEESFAVQSAAIERFAREQSLTLLATYYDAITGGTEVAERPGLSAALETVTAARVGRVLVARRERLARDAWVSQGIERMLAPYGARVLSADGQGNGDGAGDAFLRLILDGAAQHERALIRGRIRAAVALRQAQGRRVGECPYGMQPGADGHTLVAHPEEQATIGRVHALRARGLSQNEICRVLHDEGYRSRAGTPLSQTQISRIIRKVRQ
mgnify:CR=1 FL=1